MAIKPGASILKITFSGGQEFTFGPNEKIILVGPNNSGKSQTLREILEIAQSSHLPTTSVLKELVIEKKGSVNDLEHFLTDNANMVNGVFQYKSWNLNARMIPQWSQPFLRHGLAGGFIKNIDANDRLIICNRQPSIGPGEPKSKPQHVLYDDIKLMEKISGLFRQAFKKDLMFDFRGGSTIPLHVGEKPPAKLIDRVSEQYVAAVRRNPSLESQGDGMKGYAGILFEAIVADLDITLLDEPEAFLHPPQMRRLGATLAAEVTGQLIVATHSSDIMRGFLEGTKGNVRILRIRRDGDVNFVAEAPPETIAELWTRPELRYSNALEGIFHEQTIICEDDSDCRLINAVADHLATLDKKPWLDTAYVPTGGKYGVPKVASVLRKVGVPVKAVFDIDFLSERRLVQETVEAFGGDWSSVEPLWRRVDAAVRNGVKPKSNKEIKNEISSILQASKESDLPRGAITEALKQGSPWSQVKKMGVAAIPNGQAQLDYEALRKQLEAIGIYLIAVGEIEHFCKEIGLHGPKFVTKLLSQVPIGSRRLSELRKFVKAVHSGSSSVI
ncbi:AAA family ATPase [Sinorhizobium medicae]|nr:AAA family ATPase [Sinorhizobium medicae]